MTTRTKKTVLLVDDEIEYANTVRERLEAKGYNIITLASGERLLDIVRSEKPDLILLDVMMPGKKGTELCQELKADEDLRGIPVILFTAQYPQEEYLKTDYEELGADDYVLKPFEFDVLLSKIDFLIEESRK